MLELFATAWASALVVTTVLLVGVCVSQCLVRRLRGLSRGTKRAVEPSSGAPEYASAGDRAA